MLSLEQAERSIQKLFPDGKIQSNIEYRNLYVFKVFNPLPGEEEMDPFFSVNKQTGEVKEFSILTDGDINEITTLFLKAKVRTEK